MTRREADELKGHIIWALLMKELGNYSEEVRKLLLSLYYRNIKQPDLIDAKKC